MAALIFVGVYMISFPVLHQSMGVFAVICAIVFLISVNQLVERLCRAAALHFDPGLPEVDPRARIAMTVLGIAVTVGLVVLVQHPGAIGGLGDVHRLPWQDLDYTASMQVADPTTAYVREQLSDVWMECSIVTATWSTVTSGYQFVVRLA